MMNQSPQAVENEQDLQTKNPQKFYLSYILIIGFILIIIAVGITAYWLGKKTTLQPQMTVCTEDAKICPDGSSVGRIPPACEFAPCPIVQVTPTAKISESPTNTAKTQFSYQLPSGWRTTQDEAGIFEIGFNPENMKADVTSEGIIRILSYNFMLQPPIFTQYITLGLYDYDGGSRHNFIFTNMSADPTKGDAPEKYREVEYLYNGRSCLFLENIYFSALPIVWGMCDAGGGKAFLFTSHSLEYRQLLQTIRKIK